MPRIVLIFLSIILSVDVIAQSVKTDKLDSDGERTIECSQKEYKIGKDKYKMSISARCKGNSTSWHLKIQSFSVLPPNDTLLIRLGNNDVYEFTSNVVTTEDVIVRQRSVSTSEITDSKTSINPFTFSPETKSITIGTSTENPQEIKTLYTTSFIVDEEVIKQIGLHGINKLRISSEQAFNEKNWKTDKLGEFILNSWIKICTHIKKNKFKSIYEDF